MVITPAISGWYNDRKIVTPYVDSDLIEHGLSWWHGNLGQIWLIVSGTLMNKLQWNIYQNIVILIRVYSFGLSSSNCRPISSGLIKMAARLQTAFSNSHNMHTTEPSANSVHLNDGACWGLTSSVKAFCYGTDYGSGVPIPLGNVISVL